ncbi:MAG: zinc-dependent alcohol dehydrogenase family protein [Planctomycetes bacterium]|nr:zinc-dependent alcohol dehydrogenase family protein [Planctomycetota bacterium]
MKAMLLEQLGTVDQDATPLRLADWPDPLPGDDEVLIRVHACGVFHTELDEIEGRTAPSQLPMVLGHQVIGRVVAASNHVNQWREGDRVGVAWIFSACGLCSYCLSDRENLCPEFLATGRDRFGGYAQLMAARADYVYRIPDCMADVDAAPLLCAGAIGYRSLRLTNLPDGQNLGLTGFGASAHLVLKMARHRLPKTRVFVYARGQQERAFALELGAVWAGHTSEPSPVKLDAIIDTTPAWAPVVEALKNLAPGGRLVVNAIRKEEADKPELLRIDYPAHLWLEKEIKSVANVSRRDVQEFLALAAEMQIKPKTRTFPLADANQALVELKTQSLPGAKVLLVE